MSATLQVIYTIAIILFATKILGLVMRKFGFPAVLGCILAGFLIGPSIWGFVPENPIFPLNPNLITAFSEIGVLLVLFSAGLETNLGELKKMGAVATLIALGGVFIPLVLGSVVGLIFVYPETNNVFSAIFIGVIMCATSVGITVETLRELGKLKSKVGTIIVSAAIIDDVIGIIVLTVFMSLNDAGAGVTSPVLNAINPSNSAFISILWMLVYFVIAIIGGYFISKVFNSITKKHPETHRLPIYSLVVCFMYSVIAEVCFGVADITGAYIAGVVLSTNHRCAEYVDKKVAVGSYMIFGPIFFARIGMQISFEGMTLNILWFVIAFVVIAIASKIIGCGIVAKTLKFSTKDSARIGVGMIARGEVALVVAQKGISAGLMNPQHLTVVVMLVLVSSILAPILLKALYKNKVDPMPFVLENTVNVNERVETIK